MNAVDREDGHPKQRSSVAPVVLAILDGWGDRDGSDFNAIRSAETPVMDALRHAYPNTLIHASGSHVGLPDGQMGNSEVGHLTIGAGRIIRQELVRIGDTVRGNQLPAVPANPTFQIIIIVIARKNIIAISAKNDVRTVATA